MARREDRMVKVNSKSMATKEVMEVVKKKGANNTKKAVNKKVDTIIGVPKGNKT